MRAIFAGIDLRSPIIVASSGLTETVERMRLCCEHGAGGVVMKSLFEEEVCRLAPTPRFRLIARPGADVFYSYEQASEWGPERYAEEVARATESFPEMLVIPSINCLTRDAWTGYARLMEEAGARALELNTSCPHASITFRGGEVERTIAETVGRVREAVSIPLIVKVSPMLTNPPGLVKMVEDIGAQAVTLFNRFTGLDIDIDEEKPVMHGGYAGHGGGWSRFYPLRWIAAIAPETRLDIAASGGVSDAGDVIKFLLVGAKVVQTCTAVYLNGFSFLDELNRGLESWMRGKGYASLEDFRGKASPRILKNEDVERGHVLLARIKPGGFSPCKSACPGRTPVQGFVTLAAAGKVDEARELLLSWGPFQPVLARVCPGFCEDECTRALVDSPVSIRGVKRFILEGREGSVRAFAYCGASARRRDEPLRRPTGRNVAVVGSGPAGLMCAYDLARAGHEVTIFERDDGPGGLLSCAIPEFRLPRELVRGEVERISMLGVKLELGREIESAFSLVEDEGFGAAVVATGAGPGVRLKVPGGARATSALELLRSFAGGEAPKVGKRAAVIGGGNAAVDAARVLLRLGCKAVYIVYRRTRDEMPACGDELEGAEKEGVRVIYLASPVRLKEVKRGMELVCRVHVLGEEDESGRRRPERAREAGDFVLKVDSVFAALGQAPDDAVRCGLGLSPSGLASRPDRGVFAAGDCAAGPSSVIEAMSSGRNAAADVDSFLMGEDAVLEKIPEGAAVDKLHILARWRGGEAGSGGEASRCLSCGCGVGCDRCAEVCIYFAVKRSQDRYSIDPEECDGCGLCEQLCPNANIEMVSRSAVGTGG